MKNGKTWIFIAVLWSAVAMSGMVMSMLWTYQLRERVLDLEMESYYQGKMIDGLGKKYQPKKENDFGGYVEPAMTK